jgi:hypothetical protein
MKTDLLTAISSDQLASVTGGVYRPRVGDKNAVNPDGTVPIERNASGVKNDSKGLFKSLFGRRDPDAVPSPLPNFRELLGF